MSDALIGVSAVAIACILIIVLAIQIQLRGIVHKVDRILGKLEK